MNGYCRLRLFVGGFVGVSGAFALLVCAVASGPGYPEVTAGDAGAVPAGQTRIVVLRRNDVYDDYGGYPASILLDGTSAGRLAYGGFLIFDHPAGEVKLGASANRPAGGTCEITLQAEPDRTLYLVVAPRRQHVAAGLLGSAAVAAALPGFGSAVYASAAEVLARTSAEAVVSAAGGVAAQAAEGHGKTCAGPFGIAMLDESDALTYLRTLRQSD